MLESLFAPETVTLTSKFISGGFGVVIVREIFTGIRTLFSSRTAEVQLARLLESEIELTANRIRDFSVGMNEMLATNATKTSNQRKYRSDFIAPVDLALNQLSSKIFPLFQKYSPANVQDLTQFYTASDSYRTLLGYYRDTFMAPNGVSFSVDPHLSFVQRVEILKLNEVEECAGRLRDVLLKVYRGRVGWTILRRRYVYLFITFTCGLLLIFLPERDAL